jgi:O-antigen ligase
MNWLKNNLTATLFLQGLAFMLPLYHKFMPILIVLLAIRVLIDFFSSKHKICITKANGFMMLFYVFLGVGLLWTDNMRSGTFDLEVKMSLFIFPVLFSLAKFEKNIFQKVIRALVFGVFIFFIIAFCFASYTYLEKGDGLHYFLYSRLSPVVHPSYMSMYVMTALMFTLHYFKKGTYLFRTQKRTLVIVGVLFFINFMLLSKIGIFFSVLVLFYYLTLWVKVSKKYILGFSLFLSLFLFFIITYKNVGYVAQRVDEFTSVFDKDSSKNSSGIRLHIWKYAITLVQEKPILGHGTGDVKDVLVEKYTEHNLTSALEHKYNAHNQFFQILISSGLIGMVLFLLSTYFGARLSRMFLEFVLISFFYMSVESILENQAGTIFFGMFFSLLSQKSLTKV